MRILLATVLLLMLLLPAACKSSSKAQQSKPPMSKCLADITSIPEMAHLLSSHASEPSSDKAFDGMEIALTINGMISSSADPDSNEDDLCYTENNPENFKKLLDALRENQMPATVDFVVGRYMDLALQQEWLRSGNLIGNMTYGSLKAPHWSAADFIADIERGEQALAPLLQKFPQKQKYFRYPRMKLNQEYQPRTQIKAYLDQRGYQEVPVTIDAKDYKFDQIYCSARARGDTSCANYIKEEFKRLLRDTTLRARAFAKRIAGYEPKQILMFEADQFTCDNLGEILRWYKLQGVRFIALDEALCDPIYTRTGKDGETIATIIYRHVKHEQRGSTERSDQ
jgi:peptidoglycan/xylan/chitin deacetylase (PgdA/CDA1 family)